MDCTRRRAASAGWRFKKRFVRRICGQDLVRHERQAYESGKTLFIVQSAKSSAFIPGYRFLRTLAKPPSTPREWYVMTEDEIGKQVVDAAVRIHRELGPGLLETVYEVVLAREQ